MLTNNEIVFRYCIYTEVIIVSLDKKVVMLC